MKRLAHFVFASLALASASMVLPALAHAADGYVTGNVNLRAGPDSSYPLIDQIPAGTEVDVQGCTEGWEWCDVIAYGNRGWVAGNYVEYEYQDRPVLLSAYGAQIGIPIVTFVIGTYWNNYYSGRPFYRDRYRWYHQPIVHRPPPPPMRHPYRASTRGAPGYRQTNGRMHSAARATGHATHQASGARPPAYGGRAADRPAHQPSATAHRPSTQQHRADPRQLDKNTQHKGNHGH